MANGCCGDDKILSQLIMRPSLCEVRDQYFFYHLSELQSFVFFIFIFVLIKFKELEKGWCDDDKIIIPALWDLLCVRSGKRTRFIHRYLSLISPLIFHSFIRPNLFFCIFFEYLYLGVFLVMDFIITMLILMILWRNQNIGNSLKEHSHFILLLIQMLLMKILDTFRDPLWFINFATLFRFKF